jgi:hypothetical protein
MKRPLQHGFFAAAGGIAANAALARAAMRGHEPQDARLRNGLRVTGNAAFVAFAVPVALSGRVRPPASRALWHGFLGAHAVHASLIVRLARQRDSKHSFSPVSIVGGGIGYATVAALTGGAVTPGPPPPERRRRRLQRGGHNLLLGLHAFTIAHGYLAKGRDATAYAPLAALWLAAARGLSRTWR